MLRLPSVQVAPPAPLKAETLADSGRETLRSGAVGAHAARLYPERVWRARF